MIGTHIGDFEMADTVLEPREGIAHLPDQIKDLQVGGLVLGMIARILLVGEIMGCQKPLDQGIGSLGVGLGVMRLQIFDAKVKIKRLQVLCLTPGHQAALSRPA